jgi:eukaryotic-like serine/threonine-protein kinase
VTQPVSSLEKLSAALADRYAIEREIGAGGMATVYLAQDIRHRRKVAIKVLHPELSAVLGPERFLKEIELTANLQHPHILPLFDSGSADGLLYYVMPFIEGETLRGKLSRERQLPVPDAVRIAADIADALDYAHKRNVIHRDIKPENILLHDGRPMVADFGIALAVQHAGGTRMTQTGMSLGTPQYMSPEQAMGERDVDHRADIYALAAVTYEMLTGEPPFSGPTAQAIVAKVMTNDPVPPRELRKTIPQHVEAAVLTGLQKLPADRFAAAGDFRVALTDPRSDAAVRAAAPTQPATGALVRRRWLLPAAALALLALGAAAAWIAKPAPESGRLPVQFALYVDSAHQAGTACCGYQVAISPDESQLVYVGAQGGIRQLFARQMNELVAHVIPGTEGALEVFFSPDGNWLGFRARRGAGGGRGAGGDYELRKVPARGGSPLTIATVQGFPYGATWLSDGTIVFAGEGVLYAIPADGGTPTRIGLPDSSYRHPSSVAGTNAVLYARFRANGAPRVGVLDIRSGAEHYITDGARPVYSAAGYITVARGGGSLVAQSYDPRKGATSGSPRTLTDNLSRPIDYDISARGLLAYQSGTAGGAVDFVENGAAREIAIPVNANHYDSPRISPDGRRLAVAMGGMAGGHQIVVHDLERNTTLRLTFSGNNEFLAWTPDGRSLVYAGDSLVRIQPADRSAPERILLSAGPRITNQVSVGGKWLAYAVQDPADASTSDIFIALLDSTRGRPYQATPFGETAPALSPDGKWMAYVSDESGRAEVYASAMPVAGAREVISNNGGQEPVWSRDGRTLFYRTLEGAVIAVSITGQGSPTVAGRREIFRSSHELSEDGSDYDVLPDGKGLVLVRSARAGAPIVVLTNAFSDFRPTQ